MTTTLRISTTALIQAPACTISVEVTLVLNPWCFVHVLPSAKPPMIHWVFSPNWEKVKKLGVIYSTQQLIAPLSELVPHSHKHYVAKGTCVNGVQALKVGAVSHSEIKCCKKDTSRNTDNISIISNSLVFHVTMPSPCFMPQLWYAQIQIGIGRDWHVAGTYEPSGSIDFLNYATPATIFCY